MITTTPAQADDPLTAESINKVMSGLLFYQNKCGPLSPGVQKSADAFAHLADARQVEIAMLNLNSQFTAVGKDRWCTLMKVVVEKAERAYNGE